MTRLLVRLVLAMLVLPVGIAVFVFGMVAVISLAGAGGRALFVHEAVAVWLATYAVSATHWVFVWKGMVKWTRRRIALTIAGSVLSLLVGAAVAAALWIVIVGAGAPPAFPVLIGGGVPPIVWVLFTVLIWQETPDERTARLVGAGADALVCPICGYNLAAQREAVCPECGAAFKIGDLVAAQPARDARTLQDA